MAKIKLCGMFREQDIDYVNEALPDYIGFIIGFPKSHRNISPETASLLKKRLDKRIKAVGVFVDSPPQFCADIANSGTIDLIQLHGSEDADFINELRGLCNAPIIKAVKVTSAEDIEKAQTLGADFLLLDSGTGSGKAFDHSVIGKNAIKTPFFIAGGITPENSAEIVSKFDPYGIDLSSGIETEKLKDRDKIIAAVNAVRRKEMI